MCLDYYLDSIDYSSYLTEVRAELSEIYKKYETKFGSMRVQRPTQPVTTGKKKYSWVKIFADDDGGSGNLSSGSLVHSMLEFGSGATGSCYSASAASLSRRGSSASALLQAAQAGSSLAGSELTSYLDSDTVNFFYEEWSVLSWWRDHKLTYPVLSILAKDMFTVSVSTISSESAFSTTGRIVEERCRSFGSDMVEMLALPKDWEQGDAWMQHTVEDKELEAAFQDLFLDDDNNSVGAGA